MKVNRHGQGEILSDSQIDSLFTHGFLKARDRALFGVCLYTGARIGEACKLFKEDCFVEEVPRTKLILRKDSTKGKRVSREIPTHPNLTELLSVHASQNPKWKHTLYCFPGRGGMQYLSSKYADQILKEACKRVGLVGVSTHSFRRTCLTRMSDAGIPLRHIQSISGHTSLAALQRYLGVKEDDKLKAVQSLTFQGLSDP